VQPLNSFALLNRTRPTRVGLIVYGVLVLLLERFNSEVRHTCGIAGLLFLWTNTTADKPKVAEGRDSIKFHATGIIRNNLINSLRVANDIDLVDK